MQLSDLSTYNPITIQCHDNPDADAIASGFALYTYFQQAGKEVQLIYSGRNQVQKPNLCLMLERLQIPLDYVEQPQEYVRELPGGRLGGLLVTVDCQYGAGNVTKIPAEKVAVVDHHRKEITDLEMSEINPRLGSCATLVWSMLEDAGAPVTDVRVGTALYYGLYTDTNQFAEIFNPMDMDMREELPIERPLIQLFRNSNLSLHELEVAGVALIRYIYNDDYHYAIIKAQPCDPNILGLISDFLLQVAEIYVCVVYNECQDGYKLPVRSCIREVQANELAAFLTRGVGSGGGGYEKAGGFLSMALYEESYPTLHTESFFGERLNDYFDNCQVIDGNEQEIDICGMKLYEKKKAPLGFVPAAELFPVGREIVIRTSQGDLEVTVEPDLILLIGARGEVLLEKKESFEKAYKLTDRPYRGQGWTARMQYPPTARTKKGGPLKRLNNIAKICMPLESIRIYARELTKRVKLFSENRRDEYMSGDPGDYLVVPCNNKQDTCVIEREVFLNTYKWVNDGRKEIVS